MVPFREREPSFGGLLQTLVPVGQGLQSGFVVGDLPKVQRGDVPGGPRSGRRAIGRGRLVNLEWVLAQCWARMTFVSPLRQRTTVGCDTPSFSARVTTVSPSWSRYLARARWMVSVFVTLMFLLP
jgi:hypothetical protein